MRFDGETIDLASAEQWRRDLGEAFGRLEPEAYDVASRTELSGHGLGGTMTSSTLGRAGVFSVRGTPQIVRRTTRAIAAAPLDPLKVCIQVTGGATVHQNGREVVLLPGQLAIYDTGRPYDLRLSGTWACAVVTVPRNALRASGSSLDTAMGHAFSAASGPGALLAALAEYALANETPDGARAHLGEAGIELVASLLDAVPHETSSAEAQTRELVLAYVKARLHDPDLCHADVAAAHHMSPRTLHRLFESEPRSVSDTIRALRLEAVRSELKEPRWRRSPVMAVASRWGFRDQGHFTRSFKSEFGVTPAAMRRRSL